MLTFGSLFAGIGGIDLGLERAGMTCKWQVETDDYATKVLEKYWPDVARFRDVRDCGAHNLEPVDLIAGGFPCQDISHANPGGEGIDGARSGLWSEFHRIICEIRPHYVLVENVSAMLFRGMGRVLGDLAACGYDAEWDCIPAAAFGAPHLRFRVFIIAYPAAVGCDGGAHDERPSSARRNGIAPRYFEMADAESTRLSSRISYAGGFEEGVTGLEQGDWWAVEPAVDRMAHGVPNRVDRIKGTNNAVVPQVAEWLGHRIMEANLNSGSQNP